MTAARKTKRGAVMQVAKPEEILPDSLLTSYEVGALLQVNPSSINKWVKDGRIHAFRTPGGHRRIRAGDLVAFLALHQMPVPRPLHSASRRRLLIVDDDTKQTNALGRLLKNYGERIETTIVDNGVDALVKIGAGKPHVVVLDVYMPGLDGLEVCRRLKANNETKKIRIVLVSGQMTDDLEKKARAAGADLCLNKPIDIAVLLNELEASAQLTY
jgi:excisionase family DNA binding protein